MIPEPGSPYDVDDLRLVVPRFEISTIEDRNTIAVHLRRKYIKLPLFVKAFYFSCYWFFLKNGINPEKEFARTRVYKDGFSTLHGNLVKKSRVNTRHAPYLNWSKIEDSYNCKKTFYFVTARFTDPNSPAVNFGFTIRASSINTRIYFTKEDGQGIKERCKGNYTKFFEDFLENTLHYHHAAFIVSREYKSLYKIYRLIEEMKNIAVGSSFE